MVDIFREVFLSCKQVDPGSFTPREKQLVSFINTPMPPRNTQLFQASIDAGKESLSRIIRPKWT